MKNVLPYVGEALNVALLDQVRSPKHLLYVLDTNKIIISKWGSTLLLIMYLIQNQDYHLGNHHRDIMTVDQLHHMQHNSGH